MREFIVRADYDPEAGVWWASNEDLPLHDGSAQRSINSWPA